MPLKLMKILRFNFGPKIRSMNALPILAIVAAVILIPTIPAASQNTDQGVQHSAAKSIQITADKLIAKIEAAEIDFIGNVKALQAGAMVTSERLKIVYEQDAVGHKDSTTKTTAIRKMLASGRVKIVYEDMTAEADSAEYTIKSKVLVLFGQPSRLTRGGQTITGSKITLQRSDGTLKVESKGEQRVRAIFYPK